MWQLRTRSNLRPPDAASVVIHFNYDARPMPSCSWLTYPLLSYSVLMLICHVTVWPDLWPRTFVVYRLDGGQTLYHIWAKSSNQRPSYCNFNIWPNDLEQLSCVALRSKIICTKSELGQTYLFLTYSMFSRWYVMLRRDLDLWPLDLECFSTSDVMWSKSASNLGKFEQCAVELFII